MKETQALQLVWQLTLALFLLEIGYGMLVGSLGLVSDGVHTAANCLGVGTSLFSVKFSKKFNSKVYSYGIGDRAEVLAAFTNSVILLLLSAFLAFQAVHELVDDVHQRNHEDHVAYVACAGMTVNMVGLWFIAPLVGGWKELVRRLSTQDEELSGPRLLNIQSVALHICFDIVSSFGVLCTKMMSNAGFIAADPIVAVLIALLTARVASPMFRRTTRMLAQATPTGVRMDSHFRELSQVDGVLEFYQMHFWSLAPGRTVGSFVIRVRGDANADQVLTAAHKIFSPVVGHLTVQIEREKHVDVLGSNPATHSHAPPFVTGPPPQVKDAANLL